MNEKTLELEIPVLLPGIQDEDDRCLDRLESALGSRKGIRRAHLQRDQNPVQLCLHYDPGMISVDDVRRLAERTGAGIVNRFHHEQIPISGMDCSDCALVVEHSLGRVDGVLNASVSYVGQSLHIEYDSHQISRRAIEKRIHQLGYRVPSGGLRGWYHGWRELILSLLAGALLALGWAGERWLGLSPAVSVALYLAAAIIGGYDVARHALASLRERHFDTDLLMVAAALGAAILGEFAEGALLLFLFSLGHALEERTLDQARRAIRALSDLAPKTAHVLRDDGEFDIPIEQVKIGDHVLVRPGVRIPVDGEIIKGSSLVDQAPVTGESVPVFRHLGDPVYAGSVNAEDALEIRVTRLARDSTLARVAEMVARAQVQRSPTQLFTDRFVRIFVPAVLVVDLFLILIPPLFGVPFRESFLRAMTVLVAASPCALALGTPAAVLSGIAQAARNGVLIKGGAHLENLGRIQTIAFDKTGTLTTGKLAVTGVYPSPNAHLPENDLLALAAAVENRSAHPIARAISSEAKARGLDQLPVERARSTPGLGVRGRVSGREIWVGRRELFSENGKELPGQLGSLAAELEGQTLVMVGVDGKPAGLIALADRLRPEARDALQQLERLGVKRRIMLTGDREPVARRIAGAIPLTEVLPELLPEQKAGAVDELEKSYGPVAMVGDGVNDAPALARATVGIAMGGAATDVALETADVALMSDDLSRLAFAIGLGRATRAIITQNLGITLMVIVFLLLAAVSGLAGIGTAIAIHESSTLLVALNALRLMRFRQSPPGPREPGQHPPPRITGSSNGQNASS